MRDEGVAAVNVAHVLDRARISTRAFYRHFESKDDLVSVVFVEMAGLEAQSQIFAAPSVIGVAYEVILAPLVEHLEHGVGCGEFTGIDPVAAALSIHGVIWSNTERQWATGECDRFRVREHVVGFCMGALGVPAQKGNW